MPDNTVYFLAFAVYLGAVFLLAVILAILAFCRSPMPKPRGVDSPAERSKSSGEKPHRSIPLLKKLKRMSASSRTHGKITYQSSVMLRIDRNGPHTPRIQVHTQAALSTAMRDIGSMLESLQEVTQSLALFVFGAIAVHHGKHTNEIHFTQVFCETLADVVGSFHFFTNRILSSILQSSLINMACSVLREHWTWADPMDPNSADRTRQIQMVSDLKTRGFSIFIMSRASVFRLLCVLYVGCSDSAGNGVNSLASHIEQQLQNSSAYSECFQHVSFISSIALSMEAARRPFSQNFLFRMVHIILQRHLQCCVAEEDVVPGSEIDRVIKKGRENGLKSATRLVADNIAEMLSARFTPLRHADLIRSVAVHRAPSPPGAWH